MDNFQEQMEEIEQLKAEQAQAIGREPPARPCQAETDQTFSYPRKNSRRIAAREYRLPD